MPKSAPAYVPAATASTTSSPTFASSVLPSPATTSLLSSLKTRSQDVRNTATTTSTLQQPPAPPPTPAAPSWDPSTVRALLRQTNLAHLRDAAVVAWLRDACEWVPETIAYPDIRFLVIGVLDTLPWWRYMTTSGGSGRVSRNHSKTFAQLERLCILLIASSPHAVRGVVEVTMKPFTCCPVPARESEGLTPVIPRTVVHSPHCLIAARCSWRGGGDMKPFTCCPVPARESEGLTPVIPVDMVCRVWNCIATSYPHLVPDTLLWQCIEPLMPKRRWPHVAQHKAFLCRVWNCIATSYPHLVPDTLLWQCIEPLMPKRRWPHVAQHKAFLTTLLHLALDATLTPEEDSPFPNLMGGSRGGGGVDSGSDVNNTSVVVGGRRSGSMAIVVAAADEAASSDAVRSAAGSSSLYDSDVTTPSSASTTNIIHPSSPSGSAPSGGAGSRFPSDPALQMHTMATLLDASAPHNNRLMVHRNAIIQLVLRHLLDMEISFTSVGGGGETADLTKGAGGLPWQYKADPLVEAHDIQAYEVLKKCTDSVAKRLAEDLEAQGIAGTCGNASWWREVQSFHVNSILMLDRPVVLHTLAPRLAMLGTGWAGIAHVASRSRSCSWRDSEVAVGAMRRMLKWLAHERHGAAGGSAGAPQSLLETVFAQAEYISNQAGVPLSDLSEEVIQSLRGALRRDASVAEGEEVACAIARGLVLPHLYGTISAIAATTTSSSSGKYA
ncbi:Hypothetical protein, putative [Bodo saltans]|uniref:Uncharacterized protein n=1 Tax=Bodo saltans TaxID=75058 RepID=A0A0S4IZP2_BODSA|nr:Hypothetical protein, putative [Bodo saltans]|eukprot:CUG05954.1 Hypothetical protein, putative [Bodo saltans]